MYFHVFFVFFVFFSRSTSTELSLLYISNFLLRLVSFVPDLVVWLFVDVANANFPLLVFLLLVFLLLVLLSFLSLVLFLLYCIFQLSIMLVNVVKIVILFFNFNFL